MLEVELLNALYYLLFQVDTMIGCRLFIAPENAVDAVNTVVGSSAPLKNRYYFAFDNFFDFFTLFASLSQV